MNKNISMIGAGSWGTALAILLAKSGCKVKMWSCFENEIEMINNLREHKEKLPGIKIPEGVFCTGDIEESLYDSKAVVMVVPSHTVRENAKNISNYIKKDTIIVNCSKGIETETGLRLSQVICEEIPDANVVTLSGPSHAEEVANGIPTTVVAASCDIGAAESIQDIFMNPSFRVYTNSDVVGVEIGSIKMHSPMCRYF